MRLIDADALRKNAQHAKDISKWDGELLVVGLGHILNAPTIESPRDWTPCAEGLPTPDAEENGVRKRYLCTTLIPCGKLVVVELIYITIGEKPVWYDNDYYELYEGSGYQVIAWMPRPQSYNPDRTLAALGANANRKED